MTVYFDDETEIEQFNYFWNLKDKNYSKYLKEIKDFENKKDLKYLNKCQEILKNIKNLEVKKDQENLNYLLNENIIVNELKDEKGMALILFKNEPLYICINKNYEDFKNEIITNSRDNIINKVIELLKMN